MMELTPSGTFESGKVCLMAGQNGVFVDALRKAYLDPTLLPLRQSPPGKGVMTPGIVWMASMDRSYRNRRVLHELRECHDLVIHQRPRELGRFNRLGFLGLGLSGLWRCGNVDDGGLLPLS